MACLWLALGAARAEPVSYSRDVQPIFTAKCVACHACYDAPCQLNLGSAEGAVRGANKQPVYDGTRTEAQPTTRLFVDAEGEAAWRRRGFHSVLEPGAGQAALMARMLELGRRQPLAPNQRLPEGLDIGIDRLNSCPMPEEFDRFARGNPHAGMPFAVTGLDDAEYDTLQRWLAAGAPVDAQPVVASPAEQAQVAAWEALLNARGARETLVARWLYEHLFLAHLYFEGGAPGHFFELVRSRTPSGQPVVLIATRRPNEDPGATFYYRLRPVQGVIVHKTHITYPLSPARLARVRELFFAGDWQNPAIPGYGAHHRANPFETFAAIPAEARYRFMLDSAEYFVRTFIRGPVCRGQIATDVIRDRFWVLFQAPEEDLFVTDRRYAARVLPLLELPGQVDRLADFPALWPGYRDKRNRYERLRQSAYADAPAPGWRQLWQGNDQSLLTIFRHHDSAHVQRGLLGGTPQTFWLLDFPLFERTYYQLVVNFDVFGNVSHQAQTRLYFDLIRNGAEQNFLRLMPDERRASILDSWYLRSGKLKLWLDYPALDTDTPSALPLDRADPLGAFAAALLARSPHAGADRLNRCPGPGQCHRAGLPADLAAAEQALSRLANVSARWLKVIDWLPEATLLRVEGAGGRREVYSLLRDRAHSNVAFMFGESLRYQPELDTLTLAPGVLSSYPNFLFDVPAGEVPAFVMQLEQARGPKALEAIVDRWGVRRSHPAFWERFGDLARYLQETAPREAGQLDMNRYQNL